LGAWGGRWRPVHGGQWAGGDLSRGGGVLAGEEGRGLAWRIPGGKSKLMGPSIWTGMGWMDELVYELELGYPWRMAKEVWAVFGSTWGRVLPLL
jgi:hypothetical protein